MEVGSMPSDEEIKNSLAAALAHRLYDAHCEWIMNVFMAGQHNIIFPVWWEMQSDERKPYVDLAVMLIENDHTTDKAKRI